MSWVSRRGFLKATGAAVGAAVVVPSAAPVSPGSLGTFVFDGKGKVIGVVTGINALEDSVTIQVAGRVKAAYAVSDTIRRKCGFLE